MRLPFGANLSLSSKHDVASFQDVFCHPFYWQSFAWLLEPPSLVIDCGANCGHFSMLLDTCVRVKFGGSTTRYLLVEPNPQLLPVLKRNLRDAGLADRSRVLGGLLGEKTGSATLWVHPKNFLASSLSPIKGAVPHRVPFVDLSAELNGSRVDVLKVDIEGGEYAFLRENSALLGLTQLLVMEVHRAAQDEQVAMFNRIEENGLSALDGSVDADGLWLRAWQRNAHEGLGRRTSGQ